MASESKEKQKRLDPALFQSILLDDVFRKLNSIEGLIKTTIPKGAVDPLPLLTATTKPAVYQPKVGNWFSVSIVNDGPSTCWVIVNTGVSFTRPYLLKVNEVYEVDMRTAKIEDIRYYTDEGTADLRIKGVR